MTASAEQMSILSLLEESREIPLTRGMVAIVSACDFEWLNQWKWQAGRTTNGKCYVVRRATITTGVRRNLSMHRLITHAPRGTEVDHRNGDSLDNRRCNLRICTGTQNKCNRPKGTGASSQFKGVCLDKERSKWKAQIEIDYKSIALGRFDNEIEAAQAYDRAARELHGEFARLNFPKES